VLLLAALVLAQPQARPQAASALYGPDGITPGAVRQGALGSCYFHAAIAALAKAAPATLRAAIRRNNQGGYRVHFASGPDEVVLPDDLEYGRAHNLDRSEGDWVLVLMRAYAQRKVRQSLEAAIQRSTLIPASLKPVALDWLARSGVLLVAYDRAIRSVVTQNGIMDEAALKQTLAAELSAQGVSTAEAQALVGFLEEAGFIRQLSNTVRENGEVFGAYKALGQAGIPPRVMEAFMGSAHSLRVADHAMTMETLRRLHRGGLAMVAGTWSVAPPGLANANWWVDAHAFSVLDYNEARQTVIVRNPWGAHPEPDGFFTLPLATFLAAFETASFSD